jgi:hypothetical protein
MSAPGPASRSQYQLAKCGTAVIVADQVNGRDGIAAAIALIGVNEFSTL